MSCDNVLQYKVTEASNINILLEISFWHISKQRWDFGYWRVMLLPIKYTNHTLLSFAADHQLMARQTFVIKK